MILVFPIYLGKQKALWCSDAGRAILSARLHAALRVEGVDQVVVVTDEPDVLHDVWPPDAAGVRCIVREANREREISRFLPYGTRAALDAVQAMADEADMPVMVADFRCPFITSDDVSSALGEFAASGRASMVSVTALRDNPCQLEGYYTVADVGMVHIFEPAESGDAVLQSAGVLAHLPASWSGRHVTRPFPFDWAARGIAAESREESGAVLFRRSHVTDRTVEYLPFKEHQTAEISEAPACLWLYESEQQARIVASSMGHVRQEVPPLLPAGTELAGGCVRRGGAAVPYRLFRLPDGRWCLYASTDMGNDRLHLVPVCGAGRREDTSPVAEGFMEGGRSFVFECSADGVDGFAFWFLKEVGDQGGYDLRLDYPGEGGLWHTEKGSGRKLTLTTGEHISGRQLFPDVYAPMSCLGILSACSYETYDSELAQGMCLGWVLPLERSLRIASEFDMLVFKSMSEGCNCI